MTTTFTPPAPLQTAVLFLVFNRPDTTTQVFEAIRQAKPQRLYVAADGPRDGREGEFELVAKVREIATEIDWACEIKTLFREKNLGCKYAVSEAISWFFEQEEQGIILEDDCLPHQSFFFYCEKQLEMYKHNQDVWMINGFNPRHPGLDDDRYFLSRNPAVWGWATWRDRWSKYIVDISYNDGQIFHHDTLKLPHYVLSHYNKAFIAVSKGKIDTWDYQLLHLIMINNGYVAKTIPNLITNIGIEGAHSSIVGANHNVRHGSINYKFMTKLDCESGEQEDLWFYQKNYKHGFQKRLIDLVHRFYQKIKGNSP